MTLNRSKLGPIVRHVIVLGLVVLAIWHFIDLEELWLTLKRVQWPFLSLMLVLATIDRFLMGGKWQHLLCHSGIRAPFLAVVSIYYQATLVQRFVPSSLSGDAVRAVLVSRRFGNSSAVLASMVVEKLIAVFAAIFIALAGFGLLFAEAQNLILMQLLLLLPGLLVVVSAALLLSMNARLGCWVIDRLPSERLRRRLREIYRVYIAYGSAPKLLFGNFLYALLEQSVQVALFFTAALALQVDASPTTLLAAITIGQCLRKVAIILEGWLLGELTMVLVASLLGIPESQALAFSLLSRMVAIVAELPGALLLARSAVNISDLKKRTVVPAVP
jgi:glycosyltransferase 2 family protein